MPDNPDRSSVALLAGGVIGPALFITVFLIEDAVPAVRPVGFNPLRHCAIPSAGCAPAQRLGDRTCQRFVANFQGGLLGAVERHSK
jgi:hypothetical protein